MVFLIIPLLIFILYQVWYLKIEKGPQTASISATVPELPRGKRWTFVLTLFALGIGLFTYLGLYVLPKPGHWTGKACLVIGAMLIALIGAAPIQRKVDGQMIGKIYKAHMVGVGGMFFILAGQSILLWNLGPILIPLVVAIILYIGKPTRKLLSWLMEDIIAALIVLYFLML